MSWVIVEVGKINWTETTVVGPFDTWDKAEAVRRVRHLDRWAASEWGSRNVRSSVQELEAP